MANNRQPQFQNQIKTVTELKLIKSCCTIAIEIRGSARKERGSAGTEERGNEQWKRETSVWSIRL